MTRRCRRCREPFEVAATGRPRLYCSATCRSLARGQRQRNGSVHFSSVTAEWATPQNLFDELDAEFGFDLGYLREVARAHDMDEVCRIALEAEAAAGPGGGLPGFIRCCKGGQNDCIALCFDCRQAGFRLPEETVRATLLWWGLADDENVEQFAKKVRRP